MQSLTQLSLQEVKPTESQFELVEFVEDNFYARFDTAIIAKGQIHRVAIHAQRVF